MTLAEAPTHTGGVKTLPDAIDPVGCRCPQCGTGRHVPLDEADSTERLAMTLGHVRDNTGLSFAQLYAWEQANCPEENDI